jgi:hypothetical protein
MDKRIIIGIAVAGAAVVAGVATGTVKFIKTVKIARAHGMSVKEYSAHQKEIRKARKEAKKAKSGQVAGAAA